MDKSSTEKLSINEILEQMQNDKTPIYIEYPPNTEFIEGDCLVFDEEDIKKWKQERQQNMEK